MAFLLEMIERDNDDVIVHYTSVKAPTKEETITEYVTRFHGKHEPNALRTLLGLHDTIQLGHQTYTFTDLESEI